MHLPIMDGGSCGEEVLRGRAKRNGLLQLCEFGFGFFEDGDDRVGVFPEQSSE
jgi:hypothetical protein